MRDTPQGGRTCQTRNRRKSITANRALYRVVQRIDPLGSVHRKTSSWQTKGKPRPRPDGTAMSRSPSPPASDLAPLPAAEELTPLPEFKAAGTASLDLDGLLAEQPLRLHEDVRDGCGGQLWPAGLVLAKHMVRAHRDQLADARMWVPPSRLGLIMPSGRRTLTSVSPLVMTA